MLRFLATRALWSVVTLFAVITISFFMQRIAPGGPFDEEKARPKEVQAELDRAWGLDQPLSQQYFSYVGGLMSLPPDFKPSMKQPDYGVFELIKPRLAVSFSLALAVLLTALCVGLPLGILAALRRNSWVDYLMMTLALVGVALPNFVIGPFLKWIFALELGWLPESRWVSPASMVLPVASLSLLYVATVARLVRTGMLEVLSQDYVRTARAKGLSPARVVLVHALPGALAPVISYLGPAAASLAVGSVVVERVFNIPGLGNTFVEAAFNRDYTLVMGAVIVYSSLLILMNWLADVALTFVDPRVRGRT